MTVDKFNNSNILLCLLNDHSFGHCMYTIKHFILSTTIEQIYLPKLPSFFFIEQMIAVLIRKIVLKGCSDHNY